MYSDEEDLDVRIYGGDKNTCLLEDWSQSNIWVSGPETARPGTVEGSWKPWELPGSNFSDFFNFGFTPKTWDDFLLQQINKRKQKMLEKEQQIQEEQRKRMRHTDVESYSRRGLDNIPRHDDHKRSRR